MAVIAPVLTMPIVVSMLAAQMIVAKRTLEVLALIAAIPMLPAITMVVMEAMLR